MECIVQCTNFLPTVLTCSIEFYHLYFSFLKVLADYFLNLSGFSSNSFILWTCFKLLKIYLNILSMLFYNVSDNLNILSLFVPDIAVLLWLSLMVPYFCSVICFPGAVYFLWNLWDCIGIWFLENCHYPFIVYYGSLCVCVFVPLHVYLILNDRLGVRFHFLVFWLVVFSHKFLVSLTWVTFVYIWKLYITTFWNTKKGF